MYCCVPRCWLRRQLFPFSGHALERGQFPQLMPTVNVSLGLGNAQPLANYTDATSLPAYQALAEYLLQKK